jgi:two-component sensor histidine kinase
VIATTDPDGRPVATTSALSPNFSSQEDIMTELNTEVLHLSEYTLLRELNHRIINEFASAIGAISVDAARSSSAEVKLALSGVGELLHRYAKVHRALQPPATNTVVDAASYLRELCASISRLMFHDMKISLTLAADPLRLKSNRCWLLGMIVHELVTNAARHAFDGGGGEIRVALWRDGSVVRCTVRDNGSAPLGAQPGRGLKIVEELSSALGGRFTARFGPDGSHLLLVPPADDELRWRQFETIHCGSAAPSSA